MCISPIYSALIEWYNKNKLREKEDKMKELRKKYGLTQKQLSEITGIPVRTIQNWEGGQRKCPTYVADLIKFKLEYLYK